MLILVWLKWSKSCGFGFWCMDVLCYRVLFNNNMLLFKKIWVEIMFKSFIDRKICR